MPLDETDLPERTADEDLQLLCSIRQQTIEQVQLGHPKPHLVLTLETGAVFFLCGNDPN